MSFLASILDRDRSRDAERPASAGQAVTLGRFGRVRISRAPYQSLAVAGSDRRSSAATAIDRPTTHISPKPIAG